MGYHRAGFEVVGVDIAPQPHYPFKFHQGDAMTWPLDGFDVIHASPPCQRWLGVPVRAAVSAEYPDLLTPTRARLPVGLPYIIENVPGGPLDGFILCGATFQLRSFVIVDSRPHQYLLWRRPPVGSQAGRGRTDHPGTYPYAHGAWRPAWREHVLPALWPWMTLEESGQADPTRLHRMDRTSASSRLSRRQRDAPACRARPRGTARPPVRRRSTSCR